MSANLAVFKSSISQNTIIILGADLLSENSGLKKTKININSS